MRNVIQAQVVHMSLLAFVRVLGIGDSGDIRSGLCKFPDKIFATDMIQNWRDAVSMSIHS